jgi:hypothetical protein
MTGPALQLDDFGLTDLEVRWKLPRPEGVDASSRITVGYGVETSKGEPWKYRVTLKVSDELVIPDEKVMGTISATAMGFFSFPQGTPEDVRAKLIRTTGLPMLFSTLRGALRGVTGHFPPDFRYTLPTVNMLEIIAQVEGAQPEAQRHKAPVVASRGPRRRAVRRSGAGVD